jgi:ligand-binding sensor domain-containing protein/signal transduction histidine kinase
MVQILKIVWGFVFLAGMAHASFAPVCLAQIKQQGEGLMLHPEIKFEHLGMTEGLSNNMVYCAAQDERGFMWFGTQNGLNRYDGYSFTLFNHDLQDPFSLSDNMIHSIVQDKKGRLWIGTANGLNLFDPFAEKAERFHHQPQNANSLSNNFINPNAMYADREGILWVGTREGLNRFDPESGIFTTYGPKANQTLGLKSGNVTAIFKDKSGILWIGTDMGLSPLNVDRTEFAPSSPDYSFHPEVLQGKIQAISEDNRGFLWVATQNGVFIRNPYTGNFARIEEIKQDCLTLFKDSRGYMWIGSISSGIFAVHPVTGKIQHFEHDPSNPNGLSSFRVHSFAEGQPGILWIGTTNHGVDKLNLSHRQFSAYRPFFELSGFAKNADVHSLYEDKTGNIWIGTSGNGALMLDPESGKTKVYKHDPGNPNSLTNNYISAITQDKSGIFWIGTFSGGLNRFDTQTGIFTSFLPDPGNPNSISDIGVISILPEDEGLWIGTVRGGLNYFNHNTQKFTQYLPDPENPKSIGEGQINAILKDEKGYLWLTTEAGGLNRMDPKTGDFQSFKHNPADSTSISSNLTMYAYQDQNKNIWVGTRGAGLNKLDPITGKFTTFTTRHGLPDNYLVGITEDSKGNLWISTKKGICFFDPQSLVFRTYNLHDGLNTDDFKIKCLHKSERGSLYFGGVDGFSIFHPDSLHGNHYVPPVHISGFKIFNKKTYYQDKITLSYHQNFFSFDFVALNYLNPQKNQYTYRLTGFDKEWVNSDSRRLATYTDVAPGTYTFEVKGSNNDGVWNEEGASVKVIIHPPWWRTWWAYLFYILFFISSLWSFITYRSRSLRRENRILESKVTLRTGQLQEANEELLLQKEEIAAQRDNLEEKLFELQTTQNQLIQKEKMASLGELTAGIAHEIQNPLNFVNNFAEVSSELVEELKQEATADHKEEVFALAADLRQNLSKIHYHGQRADAIVKNMLQHSRTTAGEKQPTDLNALTDEYLRLAYHGLRAKDKSFNCTLDSFFDLKLEKVEVVPQDIGRVLLNLYNNAFYAVQQRQKLGHEGYQPTVTVSTHRQEGQQVEIRVRDNGTGMPESVKQKIFQPFFTTKPTGQGTGLGLSLSYDIITKGHGGELKMESVEGEGTEFTVLLPAQASSIAGSAATSMEAALPN